jgi:hypothetical protein
MSAHATKVCKECGVEKGVRNFYRCKSNRDGYVSKCKPCYCKAVNENRELKREVYEAKRREYLANPENRAKHYERIRRWRQTERGKQVMAECRKAWIILHPEQAERIKRENWRKGAEKRKARRAEQVAA